MPDRPPASPREAQPGILDGGRAAHGQLPEDGPDHPSVGEPRSRARSMVGVVRAASVVHDSDRRSDVGGVTVGLAASPAAGQARQ